MGLLGLEQNPLVARCSERKSQPCPSEMGRDGKEMTRVTEYALRFSFISLKYVVYMCVIYQLGEKRGASFAWFQFDHRTTVINKYR